MRTLQQLKDETIANLEKTLFVPEDIDDVIDAFMDVLEANGGTLRFATTVTQPAQYRDVAHQQRVACGEEDPPEPITRTVYVGTAGEKSGTGR